MIKEEERSLKGFCKEDLIRFLGKKVHIYLTNNFHYFCKIVNATDSFIEIFDFKKNISLMICIGSISLIEEVSDGN